MDESLPELFLFTPGVKSLLFFHQVIFDFLKPTNKNTADLLITNSVGAEWGWVSREKRGEAGSGQLSSARSAAAPAPRHQEARVGLCAEHLKTGRFFEECTFFF